MELDNSNNYTQFTSSAMFRDSSWKFRTGNNAIRATSNGFNISTIKYSNQYLKMDDWEYIAQTIKNNNNISTLEFIGISINYYGLKKLGEIVLNNLSIINVRLQWNYLNEYTEDFDYFCNCIANSHVAHLNLSNNRIDSSLSKSIANIIINSCNIVTIDLSWNEIGNEGARVLIESVCRKNSLREMNLIGNKINKEYIDQIEDCLYRNFKFDSIKYNTHEESKININELNKSWINQSTDKGIIKQENVSLKFLEKEKEISEEYKARYDIQIITISKLEKKIKDLESIITTERNKLNEFKEEFELEKEKERNSRMKQEDLNLELKEKLTRKAIELDEMRTICELKQSEDHKKILELENKNKYLHETSQRMNDIFEEKLRLIREDYDNNYFRLNKTLETNRAEFEKYKVDYQDEWKRKVIDYENKLKSNESINRNLNLRIDELEKINNQNLKKILEMQIEEEAKYKEIEIKIIDEEKLKYQPIIQNLENRIKALEASKEDLIERNIILNNEIISVKNSASTEKIENEKEINLLKINKNNINSKNLAITSELNKLYLEIKTKDSIINNMKKQIEDYKREHNQIKSLQDDGIAKLKEKHTIDKDNWENLKKNYESKISELEKNLENVNATLTKKDIEHAKFSNLFKKEISRIVDDKIFQYSKESKPE